MMGIPGRPVHRTWVAVWEWVVVILMRERGKMREDGEDQQAQMSQVGRWGWCMVLDYFAWVALRLCFSYWVVRMGILRLFLRLL